MNSKLTDRILASPYLSDFSMDETIDWAVEMLMQGLETPSLLILAGISKPAHRNETESYFLNALKELNISFPGKETAIHNFCGHVIRDIANGKNVRDNLEYLYATIGAEAEDRSIYDFILLYWAWGDLDLGNLFNHYWPAAVKENIESIAINLAQNWLSKHAKK